MVYVLDKRLLPAVGPKQNNFSTTSYLQIAAKIPPDRIIVLNLKEFQRLVFATLIELYLVCALYAYSRDITVDRLL